MYTSSYISEPLIAKLSQRLSLLMTYGATAYVGYLIINGHTGFSDVIQTGWLILISAIIGFIGALFGYARAEWISLLPMITGVLIAAVNIWDSSSGFATAFMVASAAASFFRFVTLTIVTKNLREIYKKHSTDNNSTVQ